VLVALPYLFRKFAQNERSLFAFLLGREPFGVQQLLEESGERLIRLEDLFEYFMANLAGGVSRNPGARHWFEVADALARSPDLGPSEARALKVVGLLTILGSVSSLKATRALVSLALEDDSESAEISAALKSLRERSLLVYRRLFGTYRVWEGGDVDIESRIEEGRQKTAGRVSVVDVLSRQLPRRPMVVRRHSYETGALRFFDLHYLEEEPANLEAFSPTGGADGMILCALPASGDHVQAFLHWGQAAGFHGRPELVVVVPAEVGSLREYAAELAAIAWVEEHTPELRDDRVARRELAERRSLVERAVAHAASALLDPRPDSEGGAGAQWLHRGVCCAPRRLRDAVTLLSVAMDLVYPSAPRVRNELINRRNLSSSAAGARRNLVERMLTHPGVERLGMEGYPPERSMYESVLLASGIHRREEGEWGFFPPPANDPVGLADVWAEMERVVFGALEEPFPLDRLFNELAAPPFGALAGVEPILLTALLMAHRDEVSLYRDNVFLPEASVADFEILMRRPELFAIAGTRVQGEREAVVNRIAQGLRAQPTTVAVIRALLGMVRGFPDTAWRTRNLPGEVLALRNALEQARSPERLLFVEIPEALGVERFDGELVVNPARIAAFFERLNAALQEWAQFAPRQTERSRDILLRACGLADGATGWQRLREQARSLESKPLISTLLPFVKRLTG
jgi:hypothetical protein